MGLSVFSTLHYLFKQSLNLVFLCLILINYFWFKSNTMKNILILSAMIWVVVILLASYLYSDTENYKYLFGILLVAAGLQNALIYNARKKQ